MLKWAASSLTEEITVITTFKGIDQSYSDPRYHDGYSCEGLPFRIMRRK
jgi:hypothetical protein